MITNRDEAYEAGRRAAEEGGVELHDLSGYMNKIGVPREFQGQWLSGLEDFYSDQGFNTETEGDGYDWERAALARLD